VEVLVRARSPDSAIRFFRRGEKIGRAMSTRAFVFLASHGARR
jgi:hypothetical protein